MEEWKQIEGYENYEVSTAGQVRNKSTGKILKPQDYNGYLRVMLYKDGKQKRFLVHRLVAIMWIPNPDNLPVVNHINENKADNRVENLEWCSQKNNIRHGTRTERQVKTLKELGINAKKIYCYELDKTFDSINEAERKTGVWATNISKCCQGKYKTAGGYHWKYVKNN